MNRISIFMVLMACGNIFLNAQVSYNWIEGRDLIKIEEIDTGEHEIILKNYVHWEYLFEEGISSPSLYVTVHKIIKVNSIDAIQRNNKIYISTYDLIDIIDLKARSVNPDGVEHHFNISNIKEIKEDEESGYKIFAVEGVELGSEIEFFYIKKSYTDYFGRLYMQENLPVRNFEFNLTCPVNLAFKFKIYNDTITEKEFVSDSNRLYIIKADKINPLFSEDFSFYNPNRKRIEFKLAHNYAQGKSELYTWDGAAQRVHELVYSISKGEQKALEKLARQIKVKTDFSLQEKIKTIEDYVKTRFYFQDVNTTQLINIEFIMANNVVNKKGLVRLYAGLFDRFGIQHNVIITSERDKVKFDASFQSWNYLNTYLFYFPGIDDYLAPENPEYRLGMIPSMLAATEGLLIEGVTIGDFNTAIGKIAYIPPLSYDKNYDNMFIDVKISDDFEKSVIDIKREFGGHNAIYIQPYFSFMEEEQKENLLKNIVKTSAEDATLNFVEAENTGVNTSLLEKPFIVKAQFESSSLIEWAGDRIIFKIGDVIAEQKEMYQEKERQTNVENDFNRMYYRVINFEIPEGYKIKNPGSIKINELYQKEGKNIYGFNSGYEITGNNLKIEIDEYYKEIFCNRENFEEFRKVVNAAADFNKIVLILEKVSSPEY